MASETSSPKKRATTLKDIAQATQLSVSTVSRALANNASIPESTRIRVVEAAQKLNYRPNAQARALRKSRTDTIGVIIPNIENPYFSSLAASIQKAAREAGVSTILSNSEENPELLGQTLAIMDDQRLDGIIVVPHIQSEEQVTDLVNRGVPVVLADRSFVNSSIPSVTSDPVPGMTEAVDLLLAADVQLGYLAGPQDTSTGQLRLNAFEKLCVDRGIVGASVYYGGYRQESGYDGIKVLIKQGANAIIAGDSMMTIGALLALHEMNLKIGEDVQLIGFDNNPIFRLQNPPLSIIDQHVQEIGKRAFEILQKLINGDTAQKSVVIPTQLSINGSTAVSQKAAAKAAKAAQKAVAKAAQNTQHEVSLDGEL
ncbi:LacI family DNA-binding transcriptional regulator [Corynebacterium glutamicum]|uniref:LacI family DNA-binding transcriptional regulator n=1 Tax=Corynebacterium glutamicum TaxID=1718 RepID=UPI000941CA3A|nr:LacI family DNA-binding transcriptional regulator [Corynebacterium glutamicum]OKX83830.1 LacI family transcriptional regulator [Corynebacterium glutamicum]QDX75427.1 LacI family transcriptional regulator [Corynebacterium glutamicum]QDX78194.1 LacI family transcriptional regulator [Corynebacterium glutamicum]TWS35696.1 LacI family transcriptional regulator [Corynebacterium glutamicum]TWS35961.1 LacI family transcriptional regulator [Corynebacterium glutamicum]